MDNRRFDAFTRALGRRGAVASIFGMLATATQFGSIARAGGPTACAERGPGERCRQSRQCCSHRCKVKKGKRKGRCRCSELRQPCADNSDCCGFDAADPSTPRCQFKSGAATTVCCKIQPGTCQSDADCCASAVPCVDGVCSD